LLDKERRIRGGVSLARDKLDSTCATLSFSRISTSNGLAVLRNPRYSGFLHGCSARGIKREPGENPELPRSGEQVRKPKMTLVPQGTGKSGE
jgi:hypothetical protein